MEIERMKRDLLILTPVKELPKNEYNLAQQHDIIGTLEGFMAMSAKIVKVQFDSTDYMNLGTAGDAFRNAIRNHGYPIKACLRNGGLYLIKKNIT